MSKFSKMRQKVRNKFDSFKTKTKNKFNEVKQNVKNKYENVKSKVIDYGDDLGDCYVAGYNKGYDDYNKLPKVVGARFAAVVGFNNGLGDKKRKIKRKFPVETNNNVKTYMPKKRNYKPHKNYSRRRTYAH